MSDFAELLDRLPLDPRFRAALAQAPDEALAEYTLTSAERTAALIQLSAWPSEVDDRAEVRSRRAYTWLSCREKACCTRTVAVTGADIARIATGQAVEPWHFVDLMPTTAEDPTGFALGQHRYRTVLRHTGPDCTFLVRTRSGAGRCGLGELAPTVCRMFPADAGEGQVCTCREWTIAAGEATLASQAQAERQSWAETAARWNELAASATDAKDVLRFALTEQAQP